MEPKLRAWGGVSRRSLLWICAAQLHKIKKTKNTFSLTTETLHVSFPSLIPERILHPHSCFHKCPSKQSSGGSDELWPKQWGWLGQGVFRALLLHTKSHQNTLACCRGDPQSLKEMTATAICCHLAHLKKHSATDWRPSFVSWAFIFKILWSNTGHLPPGLSWETQSHGYSLQKAADVLSQGWLHCSFGTLCELGRIEVLVTCLFV